MSDQSALHVRARARFREAFGPPQTSLDVEDHWSLRPDGSAVTINVLIEATSPSPSVWVFDPYDHSEGVNNVAITSEQQIDDDIIPQIRARLARARGGNR